MANTQTYSFEPLALLPPKTVLSEYIEKRVNGLIEGNFRHVFIREISSLPKVFTLKYEVHTFLEKFEIPKHFPYTSRFIVCFQETDNGCFMFFAICVQEYDSACPLPNRNTAYIAMIDSVRLFQPSSLRPSVYRIILIAYLTYLAEVGFLRTFLWSCPPGSDEEYIFYRRPTGQQNLTQNKLNSWYVDFMEPAVQFGVLDSYSTLYDWCPKSLTEFYTSMPHFLDDLWPQQLEETIKALESNKEYDGETIPCKKKASKSKPPAAKSQRFSISKYEYVFEKIETILKLNKKNYFVMNLHRYQLPKVIKKCYTPSIFASSRDNILNFFKKNCPGGFRDHFEAQLTTKTFLAYMQKSWSYVVCGVCAKCLISGTWCPTCGLDNIYTICMKKLTQDDNSTCKVSLKVDDDDDFPGYEYESRRSAKVRWYKTLRICNCPIMETVFSERMRLRDHIFIHGSSQLTPNGTSTPSPDTVQNCLRKSVALSEKNRLIKLHTSNKWTTRRCNRMASSKHVDPEFEKLPARKIKRKTSEGKYNES